jgi:DNA-binding NarL/FixJ family response regulator
MALDCGLLRQALLDLMEQEQDLEVVGDVDDPVDLLVAVGATGAQVVLLPCPVMKGRACEDGAAAGVCAHLFNEYPGLVVMGVFEDGDRVCMCRQTISTTVMPSASFTELLKGIRRCSGVPV